MAVAGLRAMLVGLLLPALVVSCTPSTGSTSSGPLSVVNADGSVDVIVNDVRVTGSPGSVVGTGLSVEPVTAPVPSAVVPLHQIVGGVEVKLSPGTTIQEPLTLSWTPHSPDVSAVPIAVHGGADGSWEFLDTEWDGTTATVQTAQFSPVLLGFVIAGALQSNWVRERVWTIFSARRTQPECTTATPSWARVWAGTNDSVQVCVEGAGDTAKVRIGSLRDFWLQVDVPPGVDIEVPDQFYEFRKAIGDVFAFDAERTVLLPPGGTMFLTVTRPEQDTTMEVTAGVTERATIANGIGATMALLSFRAEVADTSDGLKLLVLCGEDYLKSYVANKQIINLDKFGEILHCTALGGFANLRDPLRAKAAVISKYGNSLDNRTLQQQRELINREYSTFQKAGKVAVAITKIKAARDAVIAAVAPLSDAIQNLALQGEAFDIQLELSGSLKTSSRLDSFAVFDATGYEMADFASPSGAILCGLNSDRAVCMLSSAMTPSGLAQLPTDEEACGAGASSSSVSLNGIGLAGGRTYWACSGEILAYPLRGSPTAQWNAAAGFPWVTAGEVLSGPKASLPYGSAIKIGHFGCTSQTTGISCYDLTTGRGFTVNKDGVRRIAK